MPVAQNAGCTPLSFLFYYISLVSSSVSSRFLQISLKIPLTNLRSYVIMRI
ncbi:hypothetical protein RUMCAL_03500 [Ruminococcus callidus ATCC 27760]|uniref:Uncharacterized protein n=1 Tax=Ruminococcus callidus ATCC 27760 TaxID=411473 RepID=U2K3E3_9FIRM|nr:hypothetical protein RUMCAL_03500 [Ruminococcus callidus ATCC 27760]